MSFANVSALKVTNNIDAEATVIVVVNGVEFALSPTIQPNSNDVLGLSSNTDIRDGILFTARVSTQGGESKSDDTTILTHVSKAAKRAIFAISGTADQPRIHCAGYEPI